MSKQTNKKQEKKGKSQAKEKPDLTFDEALKALTQVKPEKKTDKSKKIKK